MARNFASGNYLEVASNSVFDGSIGTIAFWIKTTQTTGNVGVFSRWNGASRNGLGFILNNPSTGKMLFLGLDGSGGVAGIGLSTVTNVNTGSWVHLAASFDRSTAANECKIYVNGALDAQGTPSVAWNMGANILRWGNLVDGFWPDFVGEMADFCWWDVKLTAGEIAGLGSRASPRRVRPANLQLYIPMAA